MAKVKVSDLPEATSLDNLSDYYVIDQGASRRIDPDLLSSIKEDATSTVASASANTKRLFVDTEDSNIIKSVDESGTVETIGGGGGGSAVIAEEAGSTATAADANTKRLFLDTENANALSSIDENSVVTIVDEFIDETPATVTALETDYPASSHDGLFAWVAGVTADNGLYRSESSNWTKKADDSGDRTALWSYDPDEVVYETTNRLLGSSSETTLHTSGTVGSGDDAFDNSNSTRAIPRQDSGIGQTLSVDRTLVKFEVVKSKNGVYWTTQIRIEGYDGASWNTINIDSVSGPNASLNADGFSIDFTEPTTDNTAEIVEIISQNTTAYEGYRIYTVSTSLAFNLAYINEFRGYAIESQANEDCVKSVNRLFAGHRAINETLLTTTPYDVDADEGTLRFDATGGAITVNLPAVGDVQVGKIYTIFKIDSSANAITIDADGAETINGATTQSVTTQYGYITVQSDGTEWWIIG